MIINSFWVVCGTIVVLSSFNTTIYLNDTLVRNTRYLFPEGWGFFTKDPKESLVDIYCINEQDSTLNELDLSNTSRRNCLGLSREARMRGYEMSMLVSQLSQQCWTKDTTLDIRTHLMDSGYVLKTPNRFQYMTSGLFLLKMRPPVPWAWSSMDQEKYTPFKTLKIVVHE
ncbi:SdpA family antimicrobial peptide system protein [Chitinophaga sp.]|uniref:SdpA family antimicrobial peptide system protein n=1 Tax=Chitinophaga sp. TaxID=1869181 RepID=UPI0039C87656